MCVNPGNVNVSGFPSPRAARSRAARRPNSISRVFPGCSSSPDRANLLPVHARCGPGAQVPVGYHQPLQADMVQQRGEPRILIPPRNLAHTAQIA